MDDMTNSQPAEEPPRASDRYVNMEYNNHALLTSFFPDESPLVTAPAREEFSVAQGVEVLNPVIKLIAQPAPITWIDKSSGRL